MNIYEEAEKNFKQAIEESTEEEKREFMNGFGIWACKFALKYVKPEKDQKLYNKIYNIVYDWAKNYKKLIKINK